MVDPETKVGFYTKRERLERITYYKNKLIRRRKRVKLSRNYSGRSKAAFAKTRSNGRFITGQEDMPNNKVLKQLSYNEYETYTEFQR